MKCKYCGAEYGDNMLVCPYCKSENVKEAYKRQEDYINEYVKKRNFWATLSDRIVHKSGNVMAKGMLFAIALFVIVLVVGGLGAWIYSSTGVRRMERKLEKLENYYQAGDYEKMQDYLYKAKDTYGGSYEKYRRVAYAYSDVKLLLSNLEFIDEYWDYRTEEEMEEDFEMVCRFLHEVKMMEEDGFPYGEELAMIEFRGQVTDAMKEHLGMTEEEILAVVEKYVEDGDNDYTSEVMMFMERRGGN